MLEARHQGITFTLFLFLSKNPDALLQLCNVGWVGCLARFFILELSSRTEFRFFNLELEVGELRQLDFKYVFSMTSHNDVTLT